MLCWKPVFLAAFLLAAVPGSAQVEKVALRTTGISCGSCAPVAEMFLKRVNTVGKVFVDVEKEAILITLKPGAPFEPWDLRDAVERAEAGVVQIQISARGHAQDEGGKRYFIAGKDKFLLVASPASKLPAGAAVTVEGIVNDRPDPMELKVLNVKPVKEAPKE